MAGTAGRRKHGSADGACGQPCDAQLLLDGFMQDMCLEASRPGINAKTQVLHLVMLFPCVK